VRFRRGSSVRGLQMPSPSRPELNHPPGHLWRDKWTALSGPLAGCPGEGDAAYRGTSLIRNTPPSGPYSRTIMPRALW